MGGIVGKSAKIKPLVTAKESCAHGERVTFEEATVNSQFREARHAVHAIVWSKWKSKVDKRKYSAKAAVLMLMRSDGTIGFPGGMVEEEITGEGVSLCDAMSRVTAAINRECFEEIHLDTSVFSFKDDCYLYTEFFQERKLYCHFFNLKVEMESFVEIEASARKAYDFADKVMGIFRVPLYTMKDGLKGFPAFLCSSFVDNAREQLTSSVAALQILTEKEVEAAKAISRQHMIKKLAIVMERRDCPNHLDDDIATDNGVAVSNP